MAIQDIITVIIKGEGTMELLFEQELKLRIFQHKTTMLMTELANQYIKEQSTGEVSIPAFMTQEQAVQIASAKVQDIMAQGKLDEEYNTAWENLKNVIPDNYSTLL